MSNKTNDIYFGQLNNVRKQPFRRRVETNSNNSLKSIRDATREVLYDNNLSLEGEFNGYVLREVKNTEFDAISTVRDFMYNWVGSDVHVAQYKVRVPEVHAMIPMPQGKEDCIRADMHDTFEIIADDKMAPAPGAIVRVSFYDNNGNYNPIIKEVLHKGNGLPEIETTKEKFDEQPNVDNIATPPDVPIDSGRKSPIRPPEEYNPPPNAEGQSDLELLQRLFDKWGIRYFKASETVKHKNSIWVNQWGRPRLYPPPRDRWTNIKHTILAADRIRDEWGKSHDGGIVVTSGYRSLEYNRDIIYRQENPNDSKPPEATTSQHIFYRALDLTPQEGSYKDFVRVCDKYMRILRKQGIPTGMGIYPDSGFVHIDTGSPKGFSRRWPSQYWKGSKANNNRVADLSKL